MSSSDRDSGLPGQLAPLALATPAGRRGAAGAASAFSVDEFTGIARLQIPIATSVPRRLAPELSLIYSSSAGNGPMGLGFSLSLAAVSRYTGEGVPRYGDSDTFVLGGSAVLVPLREGPGQIEVQGVAYGVTRYAPRASATREPIERWVRLDDGDTVWRHVDATGLTSVFGCDRTARISDPANPWRVFEWLLQAQYDQYGEAISYEYLAEDGTGLPATVRETGRDRSAQRYLGLVSWAPQSAVTPPPYGIGPPPSGAWHAQMALDYGQYDADPSQPSPYWPTGAWSGRPDPFSRYEAGFEVRTHRRLANLMLFHRFAELGAEPMLTHLTRLTYEDSPMASRLVRYDSIGCKDGACAPLPPLELEYTPLSIPGGPFEPVAPPPGGERLAGMSDPPAYALADLAGEGVPSVLYADGQTVRRWPPDAPGGGYGPGGSPAAFPLERIASGPGVGLRDMTGDGFGDLLVRERERSGIYPYGEGGFQAFAPFAGAASELWSRTGALADLSGDGLPDLVVLGRGEVRRYPGAGAHGWGAPTSVPTPASMPATLDGGREALIEFADVLGGGVQQLVRVSDGAVECWPSLGYGVFGERVTLGGAPCFEDEFDARRVLLADIDGSGAADIVYVMSDRALVFVNQSGNSFAAPVTVALPVTVGACDEVALADPWGSGAQSLIVTSWTGEPRHWACPLSAGPKPYLLCSLRNALGAETDIEYESSASCWMADAADGVPWLTTLPFTVCMVASVRERDLVSGTSSTARYRYRHGCYSPQDREFGFLCVDRWDAEALEPAPTGAPRTRSQIESDAQSAAPRWTRTWRAGGGLPDAALEAGLKAEWFDGDPLACEPSGASIDWGGVTPSDGETVRQAYAALRGRTLREELYGPDGTAAAEIPYRVSQTGHEAVLVQLREGGPFAAFMTHETQTLDHLYERDASDPAVRHSLNLEVDAYGQVRQSCALAYPRRAGVPGSLPAQNAMLVTHTALGYVDLESEKAFRVGIPCEYHDRQLTGVPAPPRGACYTWQEVASLAQRALAGEGGLGASTTEWHRYLYYEADGVTPGELGQAGPQALLAYELQAAFADIEIRALFDGALADAALTALLEAGQYLDDRASGTWWGRGPRESYLPVAGFHRPASTADPCGAVTSYIYDATTVALLETDQRARETLDRSVSVQAFDYFSLQPLAVRDINDSICEVGLDPLAQVVVSSHRGSELGTPVGFAEILARQWPQAPDAAALVAEADRYLGEAAEVSLYDLLSWSGRVSSAELGQLGIDGEALLGALAQEGYVTPEGILLNAFRALAGPQALALAEPFAAHGEAIYALLRALPSGTPAHWMLVSARDYPECEPGAPEIAVDYVDGFARIVQRKLRAATGAARDGWVTSGAMRYNSRGQPYARCEPFFSEDWSFVAEALVAELGAATISTYDALDRLVRVDLPEGFFATFEIAAWSLTQNDEIDTVTESLYWHEHSDGSGIEPEQLEALRQAALSAGTPVTFALDPLGHAIARIDELNRSTGASALAPLEIEPAVAEKLYGELRANGMLDFRGALTTAFQPQEPGFSLKLSPDLAPLEGRVVDLLEGMIGSGVALVSGFGRDVLGRQLWSADPRLGATGEARCFQTTYSLSGEILLAVSADAGARLRLPDAAGRELFVLDGRNTAIATSYDALARPIAVSVREPKDAPAQTVEAYVYGDQLVEGKPVVAEASAWNLMGEVYRMFDLAGMREIDGYSLGGEPMAMTQRFLADPSAQPDWTPGQATPSSPLLESKAWSASRAYDAGGRLLVCVDAVGNTCRWTYMQTGFVASIAMALAGAQPVTYVSEVEYNAQGQRTKVGYGNGVRIEYSYDPLNARLTRALATRVADGSKVAELGYVYDPLGNLTYVEDAGFTALFGDANGSPDRAYTYDSLYRLVSATAPEPGLYAASDEREPGYEGLVLATSEGRLPPGSLVTAVRNHAYDDAGNLYWTERLTAATAWTSETIFSLFSNRGVSAQLLGLTPAAPGDAPPERTVTASEIDRFFDGDGNQTVSEGLPAAGFDYADRLSRATVTLAGGGEGSLLRGHDALNRLMRELQTSPAQSGERKLDALYLDTLEVTRATPPSGPSVTGLRARVKDGQALVAEALTDGVGGQPSIAYALGDPAGSVTVRLDEQGELLSYEAYTPYGASAFAVMGSAAEAERKLERFAGHVRDRLAGSYLFERRDYAPWLGRWLSPDPTGPIDGLNLFAFVADNPTSYTDVGGRVKIEVSKNKVIDVSPEDILEAIQQAALNLRAAARADPSKPTGTERKMDLYEASRRGDLLRLAYDSTRQGDPLTGLAVASYALRFGTLDVTEKVLGSEVGVHGTVIVGNAHRASAAMFGYDEIQSTANEEAEAKRLIHLFKVKAIPTGSNPNDAIIPVMAISETDRSVVGGLLALVELYNIKYGLRTFEEAFVHNNEPFFIGAKKRGGAKALKHLDRVRLRIDFKKGQRMTRMQTRRLHASLETFIEGLHAHRGAGKASKFRGLSTSREVADEVRRVIERRARIDAMADTQRTKRSARLAQARGLAKT